jgi:Kelch motif protein
MKPAALAALAIALLVAPTVASEVLPLQWASLPPLPIVRTDIGAATLQGRIYVVGGNAPGPDDLGTRVDMFRTNIRFWDTAPPLPRSVHNPVVLAVGYDILVLGGNVRLPAGNVAPTAETWLLDTTLPPSLQVWVPWVPLPLPMNRAAGATDGFTAIWLFGGDSVPEGGATARAWTMPVSEGTPTGVWLPLPDMPEARTRAAAAQFGNEEVWVVGGEDGNLNAKASVDILDLPTQIWRQGPPLSEAREELGLARGIGGLYAIGGRSPTFPMASVELFDRDSASWVQMPPMDEGAWGPAVSGWLEDLYVIGGRDGVGHPTSRALQMHVVTNLP